MAFSLLFLFTMQNLVSGVDVFLDYRVLPPKAEEESRNVKELNLSKRKRRKRKRKWIKGPSNFRLKWEHLSFNHRISLLNKIYIILFYRYKTLHNYIALGSGL
ncbi:hypothetical protein BGX38DRAFT_161326 [Terfezia claveryi]|nr:hypothetical protein BGX38DRAFT_161326 [Terfezia claveryi]